MNSLSAVFPISRIVGSLMSVVGGSKGAKPKVSIPSHVREVIAATAAVTGSCAFFGTIGAAVAAGILFYYSLSRNNRETARLRLIHKENKSRMLEFARQTQIDTEAQERRLQNSEKLLSYCIVEEESLDSSTFGRKIDPQNLNGPTILRFEDDDPSSI